MIPERWWMVTVETEDPLALELLPEALTEAGAEGVTEDPLRRLTAPFVPPDDPDEALRSLHAELAAEIGLPPDALRLSWRWQVHEEWEDLWKRGLGTRRIGERILVTPSWEPVEAGEGEIVIVVDPGLAFGTAEHPTTRGCLELLEGAVEPGDRVADIGTGTGILGVAALRMGATRLLAVDNDPWSIDSAIENAERNGVRDRMEVQERFAEDAWLREIGPFDGIVANIEYPVLFPLLGGFHAALAPGGWLVLGGVLRTEAERMESALAAAGFTEDRIVVEEEWWSGRFRRG